MLSRSSYAFFVFRACVVFSLLVRLAAEPHDLLLPFSVSVEVITPGFDAVLADTSGDSGSNPGRR